MVSRARIKLGIPVVRLLFQKMVAALIPAPGDFHGMTSVAFDGVLATMPDSESNRKAFGKSSNQLKPGAFPLMRIVSLMLLSTHLILDVAYGPYRGKKTGEHSLMQAILQRLKLEGQPFLFHFDALYFSFPLVYQLQEKHQHFLMKLSSAIPLHPFEGRLPDGSYFAFVKGKIEDPERSTRKRKLYRKYKILVRVIEFKIRGFKPCRLVTNLLEPSISAKELIIEYHRRWEIEIAYYEIKTIQCATLKGQSATIFRSKRSDLVQQELYAILIMYNMVRLSILKAAQTFHQNPLSISFLDSLQWIIEASPQMLNASQKRKEQIQTYLQSLMAQSRIDRPRRARINPRVVKQRRSHFPRKRESDKEIKFNLEQDLQIMGIEKQKLKPQISIENKIIQADFSKKTHTNKETLSRSENIINSNILKVS